MTNYYLDIETEGLDPTIDRILTIQIQQLDASFNASGSIEILKEWDYTGDSKEREKKMLQAFVDRTQCNDTYEFNFIPVGFNLFFEQYFLSARSAEHGLNRINIIHRPHIDLKQIALLMNKGQFKGSSLALISDKNGAGIFVPELYKNKEYSKIVDYITQESKSFLKTLSWLMIEMPVLLEKLRKK
jgi:hypothetical protein